MSFQEFLSVSTTNSVKNKGVVLPQVTFSYKHQNCLSTIQISIVFHSNPRRPYERGPQYVSVFLFTARHPSGRWTCAFHGWYQYFAIVTSQWLPYQARYIIFKIFQRYELREWWNEFFCILVCRSERGFACLNFFFPSWHNFVWKGRSCRVVV